MITERVFAIVDGEFLYARSLGQVHLALRGYQSIPGVLQASSDLANWIALPDSLSEINGLSDRDTAATNALQRFYRVVPAP